MPNCCHNNNQQAKIMQNVLFWLSLIFLVFVYLIHLVYKWYSIPLVSEYKTFSIFESRISFVRLWSSKLSNALIQPTWHWRVNAASKPSKSRYIWGKNRKVINVKFAFGARRNEVGCKSRRKLEIVKNVLKIKCLS